MKVLISWSGSVSHEVALLLRDWLPKVLQSIEPYVSTEDVDKGARWILNLANELQDTNYGIICVTKENYLRPWINFEAGALSKSVASGRVTPFLIDLQPAELSGPLAQFQSTTATQEEILRLVQVLNRISGQPQIGERELGEIVEVWWPRLVKGFDAIRAAHPAPQPKSARDLRELTEEILAIVRRIDRQGTDRLDYLAPPVLLVPPSPDEPHQSVARMEQLALEVRKLGIPEEEFFVRLSAPPSLSIVTPSNVSQEARLKIIELAQKLGFKDVELKPAPDDRP